MREQRRSSQITGITKVDLLSTAFYIASESIVTLTTETCAMCVGKERGWLLGRKIKQ